MDTVRAVVVDPAARGRLVIAEVEAPAPGPGEALVRVEATSLNRGEVQLARSAVAGWRPGRDLAGTVLQQAANGSGPALGIRVVGMRDASGVWAEQVAVPVDSLAPLPDAVSFAQAATLPVAGLTALHALRRGGLLLGRRVLVTGSTGGVGLFVLRLARLAGATSVAMVRRAADGDRVRAAGADVVVVGDDLGRLREQGPYDLVVESLGGTALTAALASLAPGGTCVDIGWSADEGAAIDVVAFNRTGGASLYGLRLDTELRGAPTTTDLALLAGLVADGRLEAPVEVEESWTRIGEVAEGLLERRFAGKAVLRIGDGG